MNTDGARQCIGFGGHEGKCTNKAGSQWSPYWCQRCDEMRIAHISKRFDEIERKFGDKA